VELWQKPQRFVCEFVQPAIVGLTPPLHQQTDLVMRRIFRAISGRGLVIGASSNGMAFIYKFPKTNVPLSFDRKALHAMLTRLDKILASREARPADESAV
jgi:putative effector of murein hydrolase